MFLFEFIRTLANKSQLIGNFGFFFCLIVNDVCKPISNRFSMETKMVITSKDLNDVL